MSHFSNKDSPLLEELTLLTKTLGCFDTNYGLINSNYTDLSPFIFENPNKMNELKAINKSITSFNLDLSLIILQYSHQHYTTSDFMHTIISYYNNNPSLIPQNMQEYHESIEFQQQLNNTDLVTEAKSIGVTYDFLKNNLSFTDKKILKFINEKKQRDLEKKRENELKQQLKHIDLEKEAKLVGIPYSLLKDNFSDLRILEMINSHKYPNNDNHENEESKNIIGLKDYVKRMDEMEYELHFPLKFECFASHQIMHRMITDHESLIIEYPPCPNQESQEKYDNFVEDVNMLKKIVEFIQNNTLNSRIYSIPTFCGDGQYWDHLGDKYYGTVFVVGETLQGNLLGFNFEQSISI